MTAYVYVLGCHGPHGYRTYVGWTLDLERRLAEHNSGGAAGAKSTRGRSWSLIYAERLATRNEAMSREWHLKRDRRLRRELARTAQGFSHGGSAPCDRPEPAASTWRATRRRV
ncbi:GIY-YIG nuclease family protein [Paracoccus sp. PAR01]|uniref:GIY-YIG nuclease family protein n=1 Tax=Paracoccus sp. PAR01 TaxID=2769282 RepID=UPI00177CFAA4|nr:GIY-YIG nuclease family protein [Paracoccus sp. PAR01]MBD9528754.1 GIY-YIG nuclease family protein [Paracoccus sp. PAR01]